ncbi:MAG TPA: hypothetical protein VFL62_17305 [Bradyrhizobium sp.]|uniref:hypothetical protein n=1 Tax=Bradyrhizobium sp. TaxID=376 RepID=UPI002D8038F4|nr:hypothetical protein [Bradyrhizobium sp.]HET7887983.1 hypothetical protein [Bradyrhizobium sp.]
MHAELDKLVAGLKEFYGREAFLFEHDLGERTMTHRLAVHIERQFPDFEVDCDFDRLGPRTLNLPRGSIVSTDDHLGKSVYPDIVVHQRRVPNNVLAIEVRKALNHQPIEHDRQKLRALTDPHIWFAYWIGVLVVLGKTGVTASEVFVSSQPHEELSQFLARRLIEAGIGGA